VDASDKRRSGTLRNTLKEKVVDLFFKKASILAGNGQKTQIICKKTKKMGKMPITYERINIWQ